MGFRVYSCVVLARSEEVVQSVLVPHNGGFIWYSYLAADSWISSDHIRPATQSEAMLPHSLENKIQYLLWLHGRCWQVSTDHDLAYTCHV